MLNALAGADLSRLQLPRRQFVAIVSVFWVAVAASAVLYAYGMDLSFQREAGKSVFVSWPTRVLQYALLFPLLLACYWKSLSLGFEPARRRWPQQALLAVAFAVTARPVLWFCSLLLEPGHDMDPAHSASHLFDVADWIGPELPLWAASASEFLVRYGFGLALVTGFAVYRDYRDAQLRMAALEQQATAARLSALRLQLSPHTLFNLLHTIRGQIAWDPPAAQAMVVQLSDLLRRLLSAGARDFVPLAEELQFVRLYLELQSRRFSDRLAFELPDPADLPAAWVPSLILQPLVENAVTHGLAGHAGPVLVRVTAAVADGQLRLTVANDTAAGRAPGKPGVGLGNVRERLQVQFGERARLATAPGRDSWASVVEMPLLGAAP